MKKNYIYPEVSVLKVTSARLMEAASPAGGGSGSGGGEIPITDDQW